MSTYTKIYYDGKRVTIPKLCKQINGLSERINTVKVLALTAAYISDDNTSTIDTKIQTSNGHNIIIQCNVVL